MTPLTKPRGRLPARVYWFRRGLVLVVAAAMIVGLARLVASFGGDSAATTAATPKPSPTTPVPTVTPTAIGTSTPSASPSATASAKAKATRAAQPALSASTGACKDSDITVAPTPGKVSGGSAVAIPLALTTKSATCTWKVSSRTLALKITSGNDRIWSSQDCPAAIPKTAVVVRPSTEARTSIKVVWGGHRSVAGCPGGQAWAKAGDYHVIAASLGGAPTDQQFTLGLPARPVVTKTAKPKATPTNAAAKPKATRTPAG